MTPEDPFETPRSRLADPEALPQRAVYRRICRFAVLLGWAPLIFVQPMMHGGGMIDVVLFSASPVVGAYCALELARMSAYPERVVWIALMLPYASLTGLSLFYALPYIPGLLGL